MVEEARTRLSQASQALALRDAVLRADTVNEGGVERLGGKGNN